MSERSRKRNGRLLERFLTWNREASRGFDRLLGIGWESIRAEERRVIESILFEGAKVADVGGGKKPFFSTKDPRIDRYVGLDLEVSELELAPVGSYDMFEACDVTRPSDALKGQFDIIICKNTLEHVLDAGDGLRGLHDMLKPGGRCYVAVPCRLALFATLNRWVPELVKRKVLFALFPEKRTDGFKAYYDQATPSRYQQLVEKCGSQITYEKRFYWSSYFTVFVPAYIAWRASTAVARAVSSDYCERFHIVFTRPAEQ